MNPRRCSDATMEKQLGLSDWMRRLSYLNPEMKPRSIAISDVDFVVYDYLSARLMFVEAKHGDASPDVAQGDLMNVVAQMMQAASGGVYTTLRGSRAVTFMGWHVLNYNGDSPENSTSLLWNGVPISYARLIRILRMQDDPTNVQPDPRDTDSTGSLGRLPDRPAAPGKAGRK